MPRIYLSPPHLAGRELDLVSDAIASNWIAPLGPHVDAFERELAAAAGVEHALALSSGTAALHLALIVHGIGVGDEVLCSTLTFAASANAIAYVGATPVFVDCDATSWTLDPALLEEAIVTRRRAGATVRALIAVDLYGQPCDYDAIAAVCARHDVLLLQDAAEALGASYRGRPVGGQGALAVFSFNGNKIITTSGGGALVGNDGARIAHARKLSTQAREPAPHYEHVEIGFNYRLSNLLAAVGRAQLAVLPDRVAARRAVFDRYAAALGSVPGISLMPEPAFGRSTRWLTCLTMQPDILGVDRETVRRALDAADIESRPVWKPMHLQPVFANSPAIGGAVSQRLFDLGLCLPSGSSLAVADQDRVIEIVLATIRNAGGPR